MTAPEDRVMLFHSTHQAIWCDRTLKKVQIEHKLIPTPRQFSSDCSYAVRYPAGEEPRVFESLKATGVEWDRTERMGS